MKKINKGLIVLLCVVFILLTISVLSLAAISVAYFLVLFCRPTSVSSACTLCFQLCECCIRTMTQVSGNVQI